MLKRWLLKPSFSSNLNIRYFAFTKAEIILLQSTVLRIIEVFSYGEAVLCTYGGFTVSLSGGGSDTQVLISDEENQAEYKKTLRLTSKQWESLKLKPGKNTVTFTVTTRYQVSLVDHAQKRG